MTGKLKFTVGWCYRLILDREHSCYADGWYDQKPHRCLSEKDGKYKFEGISELGEEPEFHSYYGHPENFVGFPNPTSDLIDKYRNM